MMWFVVVSVLVLVMVAAITLITASASRSVTIGGKAFNASVTVTGNSQFGGEVSVPAAVAGTMIAAAQSNATATTGTAWSSSVATFTTTGAHGLVVGQVIVVSGTTPTAYNGTFVVVSVPSTTTFTVAMPANPGAWVSGGTIVSYNTFICTGSNPYSVNNRIDVFWTISGVLKCRRGNTVQAVVGLSVGFSGGAGSAVPSAAQALQVNLPTELPMTIVGNNVQIAAIQSTAGGSMFDFVQSDGSTEVVSYLIPSTEPYIWDVSGPEANPFSGVTVGYCYVSHNDTTKAQTCRVGVITT